jgi:hypothetical protein
VLLQLLASFLYLLVGNEAVLRGLPSMCVGAGNKSGVIRGALA